VLADRAIFDDCNRAVLKKALAALNAPLDAPPQPLKSAKVEDDDVALARATAPSNATTTTTTTTTANVADDNAAADDNDDDDVRDVSTRSHPVGSPSAASPRAESSIDVASSPPLSNSPPPVAPPTDNTTGDASNANDNDNNNNNNNDNDNTSSK
jgi:hypothetical protein